MKHTWCIVLLAGAIAAPAAAQSDVFRLRSDAPDNASADQSAVLERQMRIVGNARDRMPVESRITAGAPYSAEALTESTQVLPDGNRINRKTTTRVYRDGEGRTRRDQVDEAGTIESTSIVDPRSGTTYVFEQRGPSASAGADVLGMTRHEAPEIVTLRHGPSGDDVIYENRTRLRTKVEAEAAADAAIGPMKMERRMAPGTGAEGESVREDLGTSTIEGLTATGTRTTTTIPAGAIGNVQPIKVVAEEWFSPELKILLMTKHSDPRTGDTVYRLVNIVRAEPDTSLFVVPAEHNRRKADVRNPEEGSH